MTKIIEAKAVISGEDRLSKVLDGLNKKMQSVGKGMRVSADVARLNKSLADAKRGLEAIERLRERQSSFSAARTKFRGAEADVARIARELEAAKKAAAQFDGIKAFGKGGGIAKEIGDARRRVTELEASLRSSQRAVSAASTAFENQSSVLKEAKAAAESAGVSVGKLGAEERRLKANVDATNFAIEKRANHTKNFGGAGAPPPVALPRGAGGARAAAGIGEAGAFGAGAALRLGAATAGIGGGAYMVGDTFRRAYQSAMSFERAMIEVGKATDASGPELDAYGEKVLALARATGKTKEELGTMLASAGFAGRPKQELMDFTEYAAKATVAWQTSADDTGQALAEIGNIYEANQKRIEQIGDAINTMADNSASRETDLLEFMRRAGASSRQAGISAEHMLAFGAALKEVGVRNEVAATGFEALLNVMKLGEEFSKSAGKGLKALGVDSTKMRKAFVAKPIETMVDLLEKLNTVADPLKKAEIMTNLFGKEYQDDVSKLLNALPKLKEYIGLMSDADKLKAGGVRFQFAQNLDKDVSKIDRATQAIDVLMKRLGEPVKGLAGGIAEQINTMVDKLESGDTILQRLIARLTGIDGKTKVELELPKVDGEKTAEEWLEEKAPWLSGKVWNEGVDGALGKTGQEARQRYLDEQEMKRGREDRAALNRPAEIEGQIEEQRRRAAELRNHHPRATDRQKGAAEADARRADTVIAGLERELAKAREAAAGVKLRQHREGGAFSLDGPAAKDRLVIDPGTGVFGFGMHGMPLPVPPPQPQLVPLPPKRPAALGKSSAGAAPELSEEAATAPAAPASEPARPAAPPVAAAPEVSPEPLSVPGIEGPAPGKTIPVEVVSLPDKSGVDGSAKTLPGAPDPAAGIPSEYKASRGFIGDLVRGPEVKTQQLPTFGDGIKTMPDQRLEATVKPDQITARVTEPVHVSGEVNETVRHEHHHTINLNTDMLDARIQSVAAQTTKSVPLTAGARPGAGSMPGAARPPGG